MKPHDNALSPLDNPFKSLFLVVILAPICVAVAFSTHFPRTTVAAALAWLLI